MLELRRAEGVIIQRFIKYANVNLDFKSIGPFLIKCFIVEVMLLPNRIIQLSSKTFDGNDLNAEIMNVTDLLSKANVVTSVIFRLLLFYRHLKND